MNSTNYKGFTIDTIDGRFVLSGGKSYATESAAKVSITKALQASEVQNSTAMHRETQSAIAAVQCHASGSVELSPSDSLDQFFAQLQTNSAIRATLVHAKARAVLPSRNKREGKYYGKVDGVKVRYGRANPCDWFHGN